jgi:hypothetical protein
MKPIGKFIAEIQGELFTSFEAREVFSKLLPTFDGEAIHGEPFTTENKLFKARLGSTIEMTRMLERIDRAARKMSQTEGDTFRYIAARDLSQRMAQYLQFAEDREFHLEDDPRLVAQTA